MLKIYKSLYSGLKIRVNAAIIWRPNFARLIFYNLILFFFSYKDSKHKDGHTKHRLQ